MKRICVICMVVLLVAGIASAQVVTGMVYAVSANLLTVITPIPNATVVLTRINATNTAPVISYRTVTGADGTYRFVLNTPLPPGTYSLTATARGYVQLRRVTFTVDPTTPSIGIYRNDIPMVQLRPTTTNLSNP